jgi:hypothetical protein
MSYSTRYKSFPFWDKLVLEELHVSRKETLTSVGGSRISQALLRRGKKGVSGSIYEMW